MSDAPVLHQDFIDFLQELHVADARFLLVGAHALAVHGVVRGTSDMDVWVEPTEANAARVWAALGAFGAPRHLLEIEELMKPGIVIQIGVPPIRIDILTAPSGLQFGPCWERSTVESIAGVPCPVLSRVDLITNKRAAGRHKDLADLERLERLP